jgi:hypothetical protein
MRKTVWGGGNGNDRVRGEENGNCRTWNDSLHLTALINNRDIKNTLSILK